MKICVTLIAISPYLGAESDYGYFIIYFAFGFHDSTQKISSHFEQKGRRDGDFPDFRFFLNFLSKFKVQGLDIVTLLGAEGPQQGPQGPRGPEGPSALHRS